MNFCVEMAENNLNLSIEGGDSSHCHTQRTYTRPNSGVNHKTILNIDDGAGENANVVALRFMKPFRKTKSAAQNSNKSRAKINSSLKMAKSDGNVSNIDNKVMTSYSSNMFDHSVESKMNADTKLNKTVRHCKLRDLYKPNNIQTTNAVFSFDRDGNHMRIDCLKLSLTSLSSSVTMQDQDAWRKAREEAFNSWLHRKEKERKKAKTVQEKAEELANKTEITKERRDELFKKWLESKKEVKEVEKKKRLNQQKKAEEDRRQRLIGKEEKIQEWIRKKNELQREMKRIEKEHEEALAKIKEEKRKNGEEAYQRWLHQAKNKPLPVPLNKGELSMRGSVSSMYINPEPWKYDEDQSTKQEAASV